ncbi:hypothetical protein CXB51_036968 [Gossypium anomalum]|uniref:Uncharacterized protein n=1 Tax=Gossypium anomalum TaxID=47600 RepID=A0A8J5Y0M8_9ROSI|nr:hypothetical protein CXB51_036968 [Gossypium anomalum]
MSNLDFNLFFPDISPAIKHRHFIPSSFVGFWLGSTPGSTPYSSAPKDSSHLNLCHYRFYTAFGLELRVDHRMCKWSAGGDSKKRTMNQKFGAAKQPTGTPSLAWSCVVVIASLLAGASVVHNIYKPDLTLPPVEDADEAKKKQSANAKE